MAFRLIPKGEGVPPKQKPPFIAIGPVGRFSLSVAAVELLTRDYAYQYAFLYWDPDVNILAIRPTKKKDSRAYRITYLNTGRNAAIAARSFCDLIGYDYSRNRSYPATWNEVESGFELNLSDGLKTQAKTISIDRQPVTRAVAVPSGVDLSRWYTRAQARERLGTSQSTLNRFVQDRKLEKEVRPFADKRSIGRQSEVVYNPYQIEDLRKQKRRPKTA